MKNQSDGIKPFEIALYFKEALPNISREQIDAVLTAYCEHWRTHHNLNLILRTIKSARTHFKSECAEEEWHALLIMILYQYVVYKVGENSIENERASAEWAAEVLSKINPPNLFTPWVWAGINATKTHTLAGVHPQYQKCTSMLIDLSLEGLGLPADMFAQNTESIWQESQPILTRREFNRGRRSWAKSFLDRPKIFYTANFFGLYETQARLNLTKLWEA